MISPSEYESCTVLFFISGLTSYRLLLKHGLSRKATNIYGSSIVLGLVGKQANAKPRARVCLVLRLPLKEQKTLRRHEDWPELTVSYERRDRRGFGG